MIHFLESASQSRRQTATFFVLVTSLAFASAVNAADLNFNVANGNFTGASNWVDATTFLPTGAAPTAADNAFIRNGGTVTINSDVIAKEIRVGARQGVTPPDYNSDTFINSPDYVLWRKGVAPLTNDNSPDTGIGPEDYLLWRRLFGGTNAQDDIGGAGTLMWTGGEITGPTGFHTGGPVLRVGRHVNLSGSQLTEYDYPGVVVQNGATAKIILASPDAKLNIGDDGTTPTPLNSYTLQNGTIGLAIGAPGLNGANGNDGIAVKNGTFTMTGGQIIDATPDDLKAGTLSTQRFLTVAGTNGTAGAETYASATFTGGVVDVWGGIRIAPGSNTRGYVNINGPITITTGGDTSIGYNATNGVGEMNMSAGTLNVGRSDVTDLDSNGNPRTTGLIGRLQVGHRGKGTLNLSGGTINVSREIRVGAEYAAGGSIINQTGGTIITPALSTGVNNDDPLAPGYTGATILINGDSASFTQTGSAGTVIGYQGKATFEIQKGTALLGGGGSTIQVGRVPTSEAIVNVKGGKLTLGGTVLRQSSSSVTPIFNLTGGTLEWNNTTTTGAQTFAAAVNNQGTTLVTKANAQLQVVPTSFAMSAGSWNIDIGLVAGVHNVLGADWFNANTATGTASLTGGTLNINYLSGFTPNVGEVFRILRGGNGVTLNSGAVTITGAGAGSWMLQTVPITTSPLTANDAEIQLKYVGPGAGLGSTAVPEPSSAVLVSFVVAGLLSARRRESRYSV